MNISLGSQAVFTPVKAVMIYKAQERQRIVLMEHDAYVESGKTRLGEGRLMSASDVTAITRTMSAAIEVRPRVLHARVLVDTPGLFAWWLPAGKRLMSFDIDWHSDVPGRERLQGRRALLPHPALVFVKVGQGRSQQTYVFALKESERPGADTPVYLGPFLNLNLDGWLCWGSTSLPDGPVQECFTRIEEAFFESTFSHQNQGDVVKVAGQSTYEFFADLCDASPDVFPVDAMLPKGTLQSVIDGLAQGS